MKTGNFLIALLIGTTIGTGATLIQKKPNIDLPEEIECISHNSNNPDTLLGFYDNDKLYIIFTGKHR